jgi:DNA-binding winged helix-turn-helix (wHTH) protein
MNRPSVRVRFGAFEVHLRSGELLDGTRKILLQEQPFQILRMLLDHAGEIITREDIQKQLWSNDTVVEFDHSINAAIRKLRLALRDSAEQPVYIETLGHRGYRFIASVQWIEPAQNDLSAADDLSA